MVKVEMTTDCEVRLRKDFSTKRITADDIKIIRSWIREMEYFGPKHISQNIQWGDHDLDREWNGYSASNFSRSGRIIYRLINYKIQICEIERITPDHDYKKR